MVCRRNSKQRELVRRFLLNREDHPTAETIYNEIKQVYPKISLGTVYRNLDLLFKSGEINVLNVGDGLSHYDYDPKPHMHFWCKCCGNIRDVPCAHLDSFAKLINSEVKGEIDNYSVCISGVCERCLKHNK